MLGFFTNVDHDRREALVAILDGQIIAVGRYDVVPGDDVDGANGVAAEVAFVVVDDHQGRGIGSDLLVRLADLARTRNITRFVAETLTENTSMQSVFRNSAFGATFHRVVGDPSVLQCTMVLDPKT